MRISFGSRGFDKGEIGCGVGGERYVKVLCWMDKCAYCLFVLYE